MKWEIIGSANVSQTRLNNQIESYENQQYNPNF